MIIITHDSHYKCVFILSQPINENCSRFYENPLKASINNKIATPSTISQIRNFQLFFKFLIQSKKVIENKILIFPQSPF